MIDEVVQRCAGEPELTLTFTPALKDAVVTQGYSATYGARPLRRAVRPHGQSALALAAGRGATHPLQRLPACPGLPSAPERSALAAWMP